MIADALDKLTGNDIVIIASVLLIAAAIAVWRLYYVERKPRIDSALTDGAVLMLSDGLVRELSPGAATLLGDCIDVPIERVLTNFLGHDETDAHTAAQTVQRTGEPTNLLIHSVAGKPFEMIGTPVGAMIRIVLRDASLLDKMTSEANEKVLKAEDYLQDQDWARSTMESLIGHAPIIVWNRDDAGQVNWSAGEIRTVGGSVTAEQAVDLIVARTRSPGLPRSRTRAHAAAGRRHGTRASVSPSPR